MAVAKQYIKSYVHAGHNLLSVEDVRKSIMYLGGPENSKVSVAEIDCIKASMAESIIKNIQSYHSISFTKKGTTFQQCFNCGKGKFVNYSYLEFQSGLVVLEPFEECVGKLICVQGKKRTVRGLKVLSARFLQVCFVCLKESTFEIRKMFFISL